MKKVGRLWFAPLQPHNDDVHFRAMIGRRPNSEVRVRDIATTNAASQISAAFKVTLGASEYERRTLQHHLRASNESKLLQRSYIRDASTNYFHS